MLSGRLLTFVTTANSGSMKVVSVIPGGGQTNSKSRDQVLGLRAGHEPLLRTHESLIF